MENSISVIKVVLGTKKEVFLREPQIRDQNTAMEIAAKRSKSDPLLLATGTNQEMLKLLLVRVDGREISRTDAERLDSMFSLPEYNQLLQVVGQLTGGGDMGEFQIEHELSGGK